MTQEEIIRIAREAGLALVYTESDEDGWRELERFAALVASAEREACAQAAEEWLPDDFDQIAQVAIAAKIRTRGQE